MKHALQMLLGCGLAFLVAFLLPALGVNGNLTIIIFIVLMLGCHLLMGRSHHKEDQ